MATCGFSKHTLIAYGYHVKQFAKFLDGKSFRSVTKEDVRAFQRTLYERNLKPGTLQAYLFSLRSLFHCLELGDQVLVSIPRQIRTRKLPTRLPHAKSEKEISRIIKAAAGARDRAILELLYASGIRVNECAQLRREDVDLSARTLIVRQGKGGDDRIALFGRPAAAALKAYFGKRESGPAFGLWLPRGGVSRRRSSSWRGDWKVTDCEGNPVFKNGKRQVLYVDLGKLSNEEGARRALAAFLAGC